jgi:hypothetical protein
MISEPGETKKLLQTINAPYSREVRLEEVRFESGMRLMRVTIREGRRFTITDIDAATARNWGEAMKQWAEAIPQDVSPDEA